VNRELLTAHKFRYGGEFSRKKNGFGLIDCQLARGTRRAASSWFSVVVPSHTFGPAVAPVGRSMPAMLCGRLVRSCHSSAGGSADEGPDVGAPGRVRSVVEDIGHAGAERPDAARRRRARPGSSGSVAASSQARCAPARRIPEVATTAVAASSASGYRGGVAVVSGRADAQATEPGVEGGMSPSNQPSSA
jgi:hypothetical protein